MKSWRGSVDQTNGNWLKLMWYRTPRLGDAGLFKGSSRKCRMGKRMTRFRSSCRGLARRGAALTSRKGRKWSERREKLEKSSQIRPALPRSVQTMPVLAVADIDLTGSPPQRGPVLLGSDSEDDDIIIIEPAASGSGRAWRGESTALTRAEQPYAPPRRVLSSAELIAVRRQAAVQRQQLEDQMLRRHAREAAQRREALILEQAHALHHLHHGIGEHELGQSLRQLSALLGDYAGRYPNGDAPPIAGLAGMYGGEPPQARGRKYSTRSSHPRKEAFGFSNSVIPPRDQDDSTLSLNRGFLKKNYPTLDTGAVFKTSQATDFVLSPVCSACNSQLYLEQIGVRRLWALRCGHVVCGGCYGEAAMRCERAKEADRKARWKFDVEPKLVGLDEGEGELDYLDEEPVVAPGIRRSTRQASVTASSKSAPPIKIPAPKGKGKSKRAHDELDDEWLACPVASCAGPKTDLLAVPGTAPDYMGAFEMFI